MAKLMLAIVITLTSLLASYGCGQKGDLYLPEQSTEKKTEQ